MIPKAEWRKKLLNLRKKIPESRRRWAAEQLLNRFKGSGPVLSFSSMGSEIDLSLLNAYLSSQGRLHLVPYDVDSLVQAPLSQISCILVPGLGFDRNYHRLGYGKGYYDQFLAQVQNIHTIGVGFTEQYCEELLPIDPWDVPVKELLLV